MTDEERDIITRFIQRVAGAPQGMAGGMAGGTAGGSPVPALPPIDPEADRLIADLFARYPEARYRLTQTAFVQEAALVQAQNRIRQLEWELQQARQAAQTAQAAQAPAAQPASPGGFFSGLFGGRPASAPQRPPANSPPNPWGQTQMPPSPPPPPPPPQWGPPPAAYAQPQMFQRGGSGFLGSALTTATGVAGGMVMGNALMNLIGGGHGGWGGGGFGGGLPASETVINNYYETDPVQNADLPLPPPDPGQADPGWDQAAYDPSADFGGMDDGWDDTQDV
jgi:hypothetical protein